MLFQTSSISGKWILLGRPIVGLVCVTFFETSNGLGQNSFNQYGSSWVGSVCEKLRMGWVGSKYKQ